MQFVSVEDDGTTRELSVDEIDYLNTEFFGSDGDRPYIKIIYQERTADGRISGFLRRWQLPPGTPVKPSP